MNAGPIIARTFLVVAGVVALGCGGAIRSEPAPAAPCADEDIVTTGDVSTFEIDGDAVLWGTVTGDVAVRDSRGTRTLGSIGSTRVVSLAVDAQTVFAVGDAGIFAFDRVQGARTTILASVDHPVAIAKNAAGLFYLESGSGFLRARLVRIEGTEVTVLASGISGASALAVDPAWVYVMTAGTRPCELVRLPVGGGAPSFVWTEACGGDRIVVDETNAYVAGDRFNYGPVPFVAVRLGSKAGTSNPLELREDVGTFAGFAVDPSFAYVALSLGATKSRLVRKPLAGGSDETLATTTGDEFGELRVSPTALFRARVRGTQPRIEKRCKPLQ